MSNLRYHAKRELELINEEPKVIEWYLSVIDAFSKAGHSGASASIAIPVLTALLHFKNLSPLTDDPSEWANHSPEMWDGTNGVWQNYRNGEAFSEDGGKTYTLLSERVSNGDGTTSPGPIHHSLHVEKSDDVSPD